jgi:hypothetical protein
MASMTKVGPEMLEQVKPNHSSQETPMVSVQNWAHHSLGRPARPVKSVSPQICIPSARIEDVSVIP